jgi:hypothetical protein
MPRWIPAIGSPGVLVGCIPRELLFPEIDNGVALNDYGVLAYGSASSPATRPPLPVFANDGSLTAWVVGRVWPRAEAEANGLVPQTLIENPPNAAYFEEHPK